MAISDLPHNLSSTMVQENSATVDRQNGGVQNGVSFLALNPHHATPTSKVTDDSDVEPLISIASLGKQPPEISSQLPIVPSFLPFSNATTSSSSALPQQASSMLSFGSTDFGSSISASLAALHHPPDHQCGALTLDYLLVLLHRFPPKDSSWISQ
ncbi:hypothetical protein NE237_020697 [Protea cynaroides]|uniref:Uncharacterized protein n=1 Tax=Protea cynaroides TaxID=273540 RepID=A0A9Q0H6L3_9MAGN|nr:hypothetical protein NE237_020697 [Protea cynaroides]